MKIKILLADDHSLVRMGLKTLIGYQKDMSVVGEARNGEEAVVLARTLKPDVIVMDLMMPKRNGAEATKAILAENPAAKVVILTSYGTSADLARAIAYGAQGAQTKDGQAENLLDSIRKVAAGKTAYAPELKECLCDVPPPELSPKQLLILESVVRGLSNNDIASQFGISPVAAKRQLTAIFAKLGAATRAEAVGIALRKHLLKD